MNNKDYIPIKGGFPRIKVPDMILMEKKEQGFANVYSIKDMIKNKKVKPLIIAKEKEELNIIDGGFQKTINGIPLNMIIG